MEPDQTSSYGMLVELRARPRRRDDLIHIVRNYLATLDGEPGTTLCTVAADANDPDVVLLWEEFRSDRAVQEHFKHDFFRALQLELADLLIEPVSLRPLNPVARRLNPDVRA